MFSHKKIQIQSVHLTAVSVAKTERQMIGAVADVGKVDLRLV